MVRIQLSQQIWCKQRSFLCEFYSSVHRIETSYK
uniref:Uncharacterized protein n=1 Tax=Myoviridae sp. ctPuP5 TaxID=2823543 RepID=A0A8S5L984_9CAUD|nr:MAG TPA: hypothetical protein [Myoviridae sp. ctPuP5]